MIEIENIHIAAETLKALAHPVRLQIIQYIDKNKTTHVNRIYNSLNLEQSITSQHLKILRSLNLVEAQRNGKHIHYTLNYEKLNKIADQINIFSES